MSVEYASIRAQFHAGSLTVTEHGSRLPPCSDNEDLFQYLSQLVMRGWGINLATFEGFALILDMERPRPEPSSVPQYLLQSSQLSVCNEARILNPKTLLEALKKPLSQNGWRELESSILFSGETWMVSLWVKEWPKLSLSDV